MTVRRVINWVISLTVGLVSTVVIIQLFNTTLEKFTLGNAIMVFLSTGAIVFIWLDFILKTNFLRR